MASWADGARWPCREGQEGRGLLGNLEGGLGKAGKGSEGRKEGACPEWGAEVGAPVPHQVCSVGVPWVSAPLALGLGGGLECCGAPLPSRSKQKDAGSVAQADRQQRLPVPSLADLGSQPEHGWSITRKEGKEAAVLTAGGKEISAGCVLISSPS